MNRERLAWIGSTVAIALLALNLPGSLAQREDDYQFVRTLIDIHRQVSVNYVEQVDEDKLRVAAIEGMLSTLDPFTVYVPPANEKAFNQQLEGNFEGVGIQLNQLPDGRVEVVTPIDGSPAFKAGVQAGDVIEKVNGDNVIGLKMQDVINKVKGPNDTDVTLTLRRVTGQVLDLTMKRTEYILPTVRGFDRSADNSWNYIVLKDPKIAYIRLTQFTGDSFASLEPVVQKLAADGIKGLVLDLRFNPGGRLEQAVQIGDLFLGKGDVIVSTKGRNRPERIETATGNSNLPKFPMAVIVNEGSASASEVLAGALSDNHRAVVVGARSYGKGSVQEVIPLDGKAGELKMTVAYYYLPSGRLVHRKKDSTDWGVDPQVPVPMDESTLRAVWESRLDSENFRRPASTQSSATPTQPTTLPVDTQLQQAVNTLVAVVLLNEKAAATQPTQAAVPPATQPAK